MLYNGTKGGFLEEKIEKIVVWTSFTQIGNFGVNFLKIFGSKSQFRSFPPSRRLGAFIVRLWDLLKW